MASMLLANGDCSSVRGSFYLGYPLHPVRKPDKLRDAHLPDIPGPQLFVSGSRDALCELELLRPVLKKIGKTAKLQVVYGADHSLTRGKRNPLRGAEHWLDAIAKFIGDCAAS